MKQNVAPTSLSIKILTLLVLLMTIGMLIGAVYEPRLLWAGTVLAVVVLFCYLSAPVAYEIKGDQLLIITRIGNKTFGPITRCSFVYDDKPSFGIRLWGNGGCLQALEYSGIKSMEFSEPMLLPVANHI